MQERTAGEDFDEEERELLEEENQAEDELFDQIQVRPIPKAQF